MTEVEQPRDDEEPLSANDERMAEILAGDNKSLSKARRRLRESEDPNAGDLLSRLDALDFVDSIVGQPGSDLPERLGEYRITDLLGRGGMGTVFEAFQESLERSVALKILSPALTTDAKMRRRFRTEARANATLHHQHIVPVYGFGESAGYLYFTMERVDGISLDKHIASSRSSSELPEPRETAGRFAGIADALGHAHRRGILHRDVKPGNILVHPDGSYALADFGLSKMLGEQSMSMSAHGGFLGTLHYAAPEQARGRDFCPASDLYSLGVSMFETLTNKLPLDGKTTEAMLEAVLHQDAPRLRSFLPKIPKDLDAVMQKLLAKEPEDRYQDGEELARDLQRVADDEPVRIRRQSVLRRVWRQMRKHPGMSTAVGVSVVLLGVVLVQNRINRQAREKLRFDQLVVDAAIEVEQQSGDPAGPDSYLLALTGRDVECDDGSAAFRDFLARAREIDAESTEPVRMLTAYETDPASEATQLLLLGRGVEAERVYTEVIDRLEQGAGLARRDSATAIQLYRLYLGRALAYLTSAYANPTAAGKDLLRASLIRRGAFFPLAVSTLIEWQPHETTDVLFSRLGALLDSAPASAVPVVGALLVSFARLEGIESANLMEFSLPYGVRRELHLRGRQMLAGQPNLEDDPGPPRWVEAQLANAARQAIENSSIVQERDPWLRRGRRVLDDHVAPGSPLQSWGFVFDLVDGIGVDGSGLQDSIRIQGLTDFLRLEPTVAVVKNLWRDERAWLEGLSHDIDGVCRLEALFLEVTSDLPADPRAALAAADNWVDADPLNPEAHLCRMRCRANGGIEAVANDASIAWQQAVDQEAMRRRIVEALKRAETVNPALAGVRQAFERRG